MLLVYVHMSLSSKLVPDCVLFIAATFNLSSQRVCTEANTLPAQGLPRAQCPRVLTVYSCIEVRLDCQVDKSPVVVKGPFFPRVVNPRYQICGTNVRCKT
jgi:hypothetical protein